MIASSLYCAQPQSIITGTVIDPEHTISTPYLVAITPDGATAYVTNNGSSTVSIIDLTKNPAVVTGIVNDPHNYINQPVGIAIAPNGRKAYVGSYANNSVTVIDLTQNPATAVKNITEPYLYPLYIAFSPDGTQAFAGYGGSSVVAVIDAVNDTFVELIDDTLAPFNTPQEIVFINGQKAYVVNQSGNSVSVIDVASHATTHYVTNSFAGFSAPYAIALSPDGTKAYVSNLSAGELHVIATATDSVTAVITNGLFEYGSGIAFTPDGTTAYATQGVGDSVVIIDAINNTVAVPATVPDPLTTINGPGGITITPNGRMGYIANLQGSTVSIMSITSVFPPTAFQGCKTKNVFLTQTDLITNLKWAAPTTGNPPVSYTLSAANGPIATIPASAPLQYTIHNCNPGSATYSLVATDAYGNISDPVSTTVTVFCSRK
jgi:YVTN family beta-propeller protein